jgi:hypothetical protein
LRVTSEGTIHPLLSRLRTGGASLAARIFWIGLSVICIVGPFFTTIFLARRMKRPAATAYQPSPGSA